MHDLESSKFSPSANRNLHTDIKKIVISDCLDIILTCKYFFKINKSLKAALNMINCSSLGSKLTKFKKVVLNTAKYSETSHDVI